MPVYGRRSLLGRILDLLLPNALVLRSSNGAPSNEGSRRAEATSPVRVMPLPCALFRRSTFVVVILIAFIVVLRRIIFRCVIDLGLLVALSRPTAARREKPLAATFASASPMKSGSDMPIEPRRTSHNRQAIDGLRCNLAFDEPVGDDDADIGRLHLPELGKRAVDDRVRRRSLVIATNAANR